MVRNSAIGSELPRSEITSSIYVQRGRNRQTDSQRDKALRQEQSEPKIVLGHTGASSLLAVLLANGENKANRKHVYGQKVYVQRLGSRPALLAAVLLPAPSL